VAIGIFWGNNFFGWIFFFPNIKVRTNYLGRVAVRA